MDLFCHDIQWYKWNLLHITQFVERSSNKVLMCLWSRWQSGDSIVTGEAIQTQLNLSQPKTVEKPDGVGQKKKKGKKKWEETVVI